jgi:hypothetical protein
MRKLRESPTIVSLKWGAVRVEGFQSSFKDVKLFPGGAREWDWNETGTKHSPGVQPDDVRELLENGSRIVILSRGKLGALKIAPETVQLLEEADVECHILSTDDAVELYKQLAGSEPVGALIHSTC